MKTIKKPMLFGTLLLLLCAAACTKEQAPENLSTPAKASPSTAFVQYIIPKGEHYATANELKAVEGTRFAFTVRFDSSCIYQTALPENQWDINKLYGFSDNSALHHQYSARIGWRWSDGALRLFAYTYNNAVRASKELAVIPIGQDVHCAISAGDGIYTFSVNEKTDTMSRLSKSAVAKGYKLYPYFGGDEAAPHTVSIWIREEK